MHISAVPAMVPNSPHFDVSLVESDAVSLIMIVSESDEDRLDVVVTVPLEVVADGGRDRVSVRKPVAVDEKDGLTVEGCDAVWVEDISLSVTLFVIGIESDTDGDGDGDIEVDIECDTVTTEDAVVLRTAEKVSAMERVRVRVTVMGSDLVKCVVYVVVDANELVTMSVSVRLWV